MRCRRGGRPSCRAAMHPACRCLPVPVVHCAALAAPRPLILPSCDTLPARSLLQRPRQRSSLQPDPHRCSTPIPSSVPHRMCELFHKCGVGCGRWLADAVGAAGGVERWGAHWSAFLWGGARCRGGVSPGNGWCQPRCPVAVWMRAMPWYGVCGSGRAAVRSSRSCGPVGRRVPGEARVNPPPGNSPPQPAPRYPLGMVRLAAIRDDPASHLLFPRSQWPHTAPVETSRNVMWGVSLLLAVPCARSWATAGGEMLRGGRVTVPAGNLSRLQGRPDGPCVSPPWLHSTADA